MVDKIFVVLHEIVRIDGLVDGSLSSKQRFGGLMFPLFKFHIPIQKQRLMQSFLSLLSLRPFLPTPHFLRLPSLLLMRLGFRMFMGRLMSSRFIMVMMLSLIGLNQLILISKYFFLGLKKLKIRRCVLRHFVVIFNFEFACHL